MPLIKYQEINLRATSLEVIDKANEIIAEYQEAGFDLTLRQLFYQFVSRALIPNSQREYKRLGSIVNDGRLAGLIDWEAIVDRTRSLRSLPHWESPRDIVEACSKQFRYNLWEDQPERVEVWIEKDALVGVIEDVCHRYDVPHFSCRGYTSASELWGAAQRLIGEGRGKHCVIFHLGDHDPSGIDMTRDIGARLELFEADVEIKRLALNIDQIRQYNPPPNPAKMADSRADEYVRRFGTSCWELDALDPRVISDLIEKAIKERLDQGPWDEALERQATARRLLEETADEWERVVEMLDGGEE